jgi:hypothetical protein
MRTSPTDADVLDAIYSVIYSVKRAEVTTELQPHQQRVLDKLQASHGVLVHHGMGSGKTLSAIAAGDRLGLPVDAVMPAPLVQNYQKELAKHVRGPYPDIRLRSYEAAARGGGKVDPDSLAIADEAQRMRNPGTSFHALARQMRGARARLLLSGTPMYNQPENLAPLLNAARGDGEVPEDPAKFREQFVGEKLVPPPLLKRLLGVKPGSVPVLKNRAKLVDLAKGYVDVHAAGADHFPRRVDEEFDVPMSDTQHEVYKFHEGSLPWYLRMKIRANLPLTKTEAEDLNAFSSGLRQSANTPRPYVEDMADDEELAAAPKIQKAVEELVKARENDPHFRGVVYSNYLDAGLKPYQRALEQRGVASGIFHGGLTPGQRRQLLDRFDRGDLPALLLSSSGAEGLDLKGTKLMQLLEPHFNPSKTDQVIARGIRYKSHDHLPEDERQVRVQRFYAAHPKSFVNKILGTAPPTSIDRYLYDRSEEKRRLFQQFTDALQEASDAGPLK